MIKSFTLYCYLAIYYLRPTEWISANEIRLLLYCAYIAAIIIIYDFLCSAKKLRTDKTDYYFIIFLCLLIFSKLLTGWFDGTVAMVYKMLPCAVGFYLITITCTTTKRFDNVYFLLVILTTFISWQISIQMETGQAIGELGPRYRRTRDLEGNLLLLPQAIWYGVFRDPNDLGMALATIVPFVLNKVIKKKLLYIIPLIFIIVAIYYTNSRGTILALIAGVGLYFVLKRRSIRGLGVAALIGSLIIVFGPSRIGGLSGNDESTQSRLEAWYVGYQVFKANPIFGAGPDTFQDYHHLTTHNTYVLLMAEAGFLGSMFFSGLMLIPIYSGIKIAFKEDNPQMRADLSAVISGFFALCFSIMLLSRPYVLLPYLFCALTITYQRINYPALLTIITAPIKSMHLILLTVVQIIFFHGIIRLL